MDLNTITSYRFARTRADLALGAGEQIVSGGTWLFSEPQLESSGFVDLTTMDWPTLEYLADGLRIGATCTIAELARWPGRPDSPGQANWTAQPLFAECANALLSSFKVWNVATVGGNICRSFAAGALVSLCVALDGVALVWTRAGDSYRIPVAELVTGNGTNTLQSGDVLRAIDIPGQALRARTAFRKIALAELGRSGAVLTGRVDADGGTTFTITAATLRPIVLRYPVLPDPGVLTRAADAVTDYFTDPFGAADWRRAVSGVLLEEVRQELAG
jgi:xanthine dehydrogenase FAD-binding subunit